MMSFVKRISLFFVFLGLLLIIIGFSRGYRIDIKEKTITSTGILAVSSNPKPAKVFLDGQLKGVTDLNLTLPPGKYQVKVEKEGYTAWTKDVVIRGELVVSLNPVLFPINPSLSPLTNLGITKAVPLNQTDRLLIVSQKNDPEKDGFYLFEIPKTPINIIPPLKTILLAQKLPKTIDINLAKIYFSYDFKEAIIELPKKEKSHSNQAFLLDLNKENLIPFDISSSKEILLESWENQERDLNQRILATYPKEMAKIATMSFEIISFSPDENKILYLAKKNQTLPPFITPPLGINQTPQNRQIKEGELYVFDRKEDTNYHLSNIPKIIYKNYLKDNQKLLKQLIQWHPNSRHLIFIENKKIVALEYDNTNKQTLYAGPFDDNFFSVTSTGNLVILTNFNPENNPYFDLYLIRL